jgi:hypothetical protein
MVKRGKTGRQYNDQKSNLKTGRQSNGQRSEPFWPLYFLHSFGHYIIFSSSDYSFDHYIVFPSSDYSFDHYIVFPRRREDNIMVKRGKTGRQYNGQRGKTGRLLTIIFSSLFWPLYCLPVFRLLFWPLYCLPVFTFLTIIFSSLF